MYKRPLHRPGLNAMQATLWACMAEGLLLILAHGLCIVCKKEWSIELSFSWAHVIVSFFFIMLFARWVLIAAVELYQRYAPAHIREKCCCTPSCSEYAIMALNKYYWPKACWKIYIRLTRTCQGAERIIDYP